MKPTTTELPAVTYKEAITMLNGLCEGLGMAMDILPDNFFIYTAKHGQLSEFLYGKRWFDYNGGYDFWSDIHKMLLEIESGAGIKQTTKNK